MVLQDAELKAQWIAELDEMHREFMQRIRPSITQMARMLVNSHRDAGDTLLMISATNEFIITPIAREFGIENIIGISLETDAQGNRLKVPHMGWNNVHQTQAHPLFAHIPQDERFYFVHSYYFAPAQPEITLATSQYPQEFACIIGKDNVFATQFHTEKSHEAGLQLLQNFLHWQP